jgi:hypothetical protein
MQFGFTIIGTRHVVSFVLLRAVLPRFSSDLQTRPRGVARYNVKLDEGHVTTNDHRDRAGKTRNHSRHHRNVFAAKAECEDCAGTQRERQQEYPEQK